MNYLELTSNSLLYERNNNILRTCRLWISNSLPLFPRLYFQLTLYSMSKPESFEIDRNKLSLKKKAMLDKFVKRFIKDFRETMELLGSE